MTTFKIGRRSVKVSKADKVLFPDEGITKGDLADYYRRIAAVMRPHVRGRPVSMHRYPDGISNGDFYQKEVPDYFPDWIERTRVELGSGETQEQVVLGAAAVLVYLADQACITPHVWLSRADRLDHPDRMIFDLDPSREDVDLLRDAARRLHDLLEEIGVAAFLQTTGSRGLHVVVPVDRGPSFDAVRAFAEDVAELLVKRYPGDLTTAQRKAARGKRLLVDVMRNAYGQTAVPPYAVRARPGAPVATPLEWSELGSDGFHPRRYTVENIFRRLGQRECPWMGIGRHGRSLDPPRDRLDRLRDEAGLPTG